MSELDAATAGAALTVPVLVVMVSSRACAIPVSYVTETMPPLPIEPVAGTPEYVRGISVIRGAPIPVVDLAALLESRSGRAAYGRFVTVKVGQRRFALAVESVLGVRRLDLSQFEELPALLRDAGAGPIEAIGVADAQLLVVLRAARIVPDEIWTTLAAGMQTR